MSQEPSNERPSQSAASPEAAVSKAVSPQVRQQIAVLRSDRHNRRSLFELGSTYAFIGLALWMTQHPFHWMAYPLAFLLMGMMQYRLVMSSHEAVHKTLLSPVWLNETFGSVNAGLVGISFFNYRKTHLDHHKSPQHIRDDTDAYIYRPLLLSKPGLPRLSLLLLGVWMDIYVKLKRKIAGVRPTEKTSSPVGKATDSQLWLIATLQILLLTGFSLGAQWWQYFVFWFAPIFVIALTMDRIRIFVEHGYWYLFFEPAISVDEAWQATVDIQTNPLEAYILAPFGFDSHQAHHAQLTVPYYNLKRLSDLLRAHDNRYHALVKGSYLGILRRMIWASK